MANALGKRLGVTAAMIKKVKREETLLTSKAQAALPAGDIERFRVLITERDAQTAWLRAYAY